MNNLPTIVGSIASVLTAAIVVGAMTYGCSEARRSYYDAQKNCVSVGGSWVPHGGSDSYTASCVYGRHS